MKLSTACYCCWIFGQLFTSRSMLISLEVAFVRSWINEPPSYMIRSLKEYFSSPVARQPRLSRGMSRLLLLLLSERKFLRRTPTAPEARDAVSMGETTPVSASMSSSISRSYAKRRAKATRRRRRRPPLSIHQLSVFFVSRSFRSLPPALNSPCN